MTAVWGVAVLLLPAQWARRTSTQVSERWRGEGRGREGRVDKISLGNNQKQWKGAHLGRKLVHFLTLRWYPPCSLGPGAARCVLTYERISIIHVITFSVAHPR